MSKRRQHYVPKLYLKTFQSTPKRIHLCHLATLSSFRDASLRKQCYIHNFYGSVEIEDSFGELENAAAPVLRAICASGEPPPFRSEEHGALLAFVGIQAHRTPTARQNIKDAWVKMDEQIFGDSEPDLDSGLSRFSPVADAEALELQLKFLPEYINAISDLRLHVVRTSLRERLITSDNPLVKYNSYCRGIPYWGALGAKCRGLQMFLPLSPRVLLLMYDDAVYKMGGEEGDQGAPRAISKKDVDRINALQVFNAQYCIYFSEWAQSGDVERLARTYLPRKSDVMRVGEGELAGSDTSSIIHLWEKQPDLPFSVPLSQLRWQASKVPLKDRVNLYRN